MARLCRACDTSRRNYCNRYSCANKPLGVCLFSAASNSSSGKSFGKPVASARWKLVNRAFDASKVVACHAFLPSSIANKYASKEPMNGRPRRPLAGDVCDKAVVPGLPYRGYSPLLVMVVR